MGIQKWFDIWNEEFWFSKITFIRGYPEWILKRYKFNRNGQKNDSSLRALGSPVASLKWVSKNYFLFLNSSFHFFQIAFIRGWSNLGIERTEVERKGAQEVHVFARNHVYNSQMGIQIWFHICKWRIFFSKITFIRGLPESTLKRYEFDRNGPKNASTLRELKNPPISLKWVSKNYFIFLNP